ncbi:MAG: hypothetical protein GC155_06190 [Alphaproteobacteria bacterium]|nr:hypothetical protein [Alphaproteobacteria bacterium]
MQRLYIAATAVLFGVSAALGFIAARWFVLAIYAGSPYWPVLLMFAAAASIGCGLSFVSMYVNLIDLLEPIWRRPVSEED